MISWSFCSCWRPPEVSVPDVAGRTEEERRSTGQSASRVVMAKEEVDSDFGEKELES